MSTEKAISDGEIFVDGIHNLRGELITLISPRRLYELPTREVANEKIQIFRHKGQKYGIVVDSVDEIVNTTEVQIPEAPRITDNQATRRVSSDVMGCIPLPSRSIDADLDMVIDVDALVARRAGAETSAAETTSEVSKVSAGLKR